MNSNILTAVVICFILLSGFECEKQNQLKDCYKGKLEIKAMCMNYTISVQSDDMNTSLIEKSWTDPHTGKTYSNVFALANPCSFPADIKEGDEFYFSVVEKTTQDCVICMAYYPTPEKKLTIEVMKSGCVSD